MKTHSNSDMDSECDDVFTDDSKGALGDENGCHMINRKRRRGIIEKRRRDRINSSLSELRRLVPAAFEKQGSAKLEKAEILQMTVDHLKVLHTKGLDPFGFEPHQFAMDYHGIGFRECTAEVARYLVGMEGMDLQDPLRMRLLSHLQCFAAQRDLAIKSTPSSPWSPLFTPSPQYPMVQQPPSVNGTSSSVSSDRSSTSLCSGDFSGSTRTSSNARLSSGSTSEPSTVSSPTHGTRLPSSPTPLKNGSPLRLAAEPSSPLSGFAAGHSLSRLSNSQREVVRPYRPWGTELAY